MGTLNKQIWVNHLSGNFYPDSSFLKHVRDFSTLVDNDVINMAEAGVDPNVYINNTTYPIKTAQRIDKPISIELDLFETENTLIRRPEVLEFAYDQMESVLMGHRNQLRAVTAAKAAHAFAPQKNTEFTPVIATTGGQAADGRKRLTIEDILHLKERFDNANIPQEGRFLVLHPKHLSDLILFDVKAFKDITDFVNGQPQRFAGFSILQTSVTAIYNNTTKEKVAFSAEKANTDTFCSFAFQKDEVMKADGQVHMYARLDDPEERGAIVGFDKRFIALPIRNKGVGAIVSEGTGGVSYYAMKSQVTVKKESEINAAHEVVESETE